MRARRTKFFPTYSPVCPIPNLSTSLYSVVVICKDWQVLTALPSKSIFFTPPHSFLCCSSTGLLSVADTQRSSLSAWNVPFPHIYKAGSLIFFRSQFITYFRERCPLHHPFWMVPASYITLYPITLFYFNVSVITIWNPTSLWTYSLFASPQ